MDDREGPGRAETLTQVLCDAAEAVRLAAVLLLPVMPTTAAEILRRSGEDDGAGGRSARPSRRVADIRADARQRSRSLASSREPSAASAAGVSTVSDPTTPSPADWSAPIVAPTSPAPASESGAPTAAGSTTLTPEAAPVTDGRIAIDQFMSVELRVARVLAAERVPKSKKLLQLRIDAGSEERTIVAGIAEAYEPEPLVGRLIVIVANLKPAETDGHREQRDGARVERRGRQAGAGVAGRGRGAWRPCQVSAEFEAGMPSCKNQLSRGIQRTAHFTRDSALQTSALR